MSRKPAGYWSKERCQKEALKYDKRWGFGKSSRVAYEMARKNGWLDDICSHMIIENIEERYIYCIWFDDECVYVGISCNPKNRFAQHLSGKKSSVYKYITENNCNPILKIITEEPVTEKEAQELECYYIDKYKAEGYCVINKQSGGGLGTSTIKWTKEKVIEESSISENNEDGVTISTEEKKTDIRAEHLSRTSKTNVHHVEKVSKEKMILQ